MPTLSDAPPSAAAGSRVGLLGGSFNPAHAGHLHISRLALDRLRLDAVWWLVSPQNPLKPDRGMAPLADRMGAACSATAGEERIVVTDIERELDSRYTVDTLRAIKTRYPGIRFVWLMGADILTEIPRWRRWREVFRTVPIAVFARPSYSFRAESGYAARRFAMARIGERKAASLANKRPPAWILLKTPLHSASASEIRARGAHRVSA